MKQKINLLLLFMALIWGSIQAQETKQTTVPFDKGTLTFSYYEKDGIKIPHGSMEYIADRYSEKGEMVDGYKEGEWTIIAKLTKEMQRNTFTYKNGLLEGKVIFSTFEINPKNNQENLISQDEYIYRKGHLFGENKIVHDNDTLYCYYDENGDRTGIWKLIQRNHTYMAEYPTSNPEDTKAYEIDILGEKTVFPAGTFSMYSSLVLSWIDLWRIQYRPYTVKEDRPNLPSLCKIKYGHRSSHKRVNDE